MTGLHTQVIKTDSKFPARAHMVTTRLERSIITDKLAFEYRPDRKWHRVQKVCFWLLNKIGAFHRKTVEQVYFDKLQAEDLHKLIFSALESVYKNWWDPQIRDDLVVCVGNQDWAELVSSTAARYWMQPLTYMTGPYRCFNGLDNKSSPFGVQIAVIPWIKGVVVIPRSAVKHIV